MQYISLLEETVILLSFYIILYCKHSHSILRITMMPHLLMVLMCDFQFNLYFDMHIACSLAKYQCIHSIILTSFL